MVIADKTDRFASMRRTFLSDDDGLRGILNDVGRTASITRNAVAAVRLDTDMVRSAR